MFLRLKAFSNNHAEIPPTTVWPQLVTRLDSVNADLAEQVAAAQRAGRHDQSN